MNRTLASGEEEMKLAWLLSFPNSGTRYTMKMTQDLFLRRAATNYPLASKGEFSPVFSGVMGPFWANDRELGPPKKNGGYVLTKTHCGGYAHGDCVLGSCVLSPEQFRERCRTMIILTRRRQREEVRLYDQRVVVKKGVHLIRDPFDNLVSRFHHYRMVLDKVQQFPDDSPSEFLRFCAMRDKALPGPQVLRSHLDDNETISQLLIIPCHVDLLAYINWHNNAFKMSHIYNAHMDIQMVHYEDYGSDWNATTSWLSDFLEQPRLGLSDVVPFQSGKTYRDVYFTQEQRDATEHVVRRIANDDLWSSLERYFRRVQDGTDNHGHAAVVLDATTRTVEETSVLPSAAAVTLVGGWELRRVYKDASILSASSNFALVAIYAMWWARRSATR